MPITRLLATALFGCSLLLSPASQAASKMEIKTQATHVKALRKDLKGLQKLTAKWDKANSKGKDTGKIDGELEKIVKAELVWLRKNGQPTAKKELAEGEEEANPWMARMRDAAVGVRDAKSTVEKKNHLEQLQNSLQTRIDRQQRKLDGMEG